MCSGTALNIAYSDEPLTSRCDRIAIGSVDINRTAKTSSTYAAHAVNVSRAPPPGAAAVPRARREGRHRHGRARAVCNRVAFSLSATRRGVEPVPLTTPVA